MKRLFSSTGKASNEAFEKLVLPFEKMPGPRGFLGIGNFYNYFKAFGSYSFDELHRNGMINSSKFGSLVCERMIPGVNIVWVFDPETIADVFKLDGPTNLPCRRSHLALEKYRKDRPSVYRTAGLLPSNGEEWWKLRSEFQKGLSSPKNVRNFLSEADLTVKDFVKLLPQRFDEKSEIKETLEELSRVYLELTCQIAFDERLNSFTDKERLPDSRSSRLIKAAEDTNHSILPTDQGLPLWRFFETKDYKKLRESQEFMEKVAVELVAKKAKQTDNGNSLLDQYLKNPNVDIKDIHGMAADLLLAGVHTTSFTTAFALHYISKDKRVQDLLYQEAKQVLPNFDNPITPEIMNSGIPYTRAVLKETFRLNPISIGIGRIANNDIILGGYQVPKDTIIVTQNLVACRMEKHFPDPLKFVPERWLKTSKDKQSNVHPYLVLPFGHGMRSCIARRFAEQNMLLTLLRLIRCYKIEWRGISETLDLKTKLINQPSSEISLKFEKRET